MKYYFAFLITLFTAAIRSQNLLNGDFENTSVSICDFNLLNIHFNAKMADAYAFGIKNEVDIQTHNCGYISSPASGSFFISLHSGLDTVMKTDAVALRFSSPLIPGKTYMLSYFQRSDTSFHTHTIDSLCIGVSNDSTKVGQVVYTSEVLPFNFWVNKNFTFVPAQSARFLTLSNKNLKDGWNFVDDFRLVDVTGTNDYSISGIQVYPNPSNGLFTIRTPHSCNLVVSDCAGKIYISQELNGDGEDNSFSLSNDGLYILKIQNKDKIIYHRLSIINKH